MRSLAGPFWVTSKSYALPLHLLLICAPLTLTYMRPASYSTVIKSLAQSYTYAQRAWLHLFNFPCCYAVSVIIYRGFTFQSFTKMWISKQQMQHFPHSTDDDLHQKSEHLRTPRRTWEHGIPPELHQPRYPSFPRVQDNDNVICRKAPLDGAGCAYLQLNSDKHC